MGAPPPVMFSRPANMLSTRPELRPNAAENVLRLSIMPCKGLALSARIPSSCVQRRPGRAPQTFGFVGGGDQQGRLAVFARLQHRRRSAARQETVAPAIRPWESTPTSRVLPDRRRSIHGDFGHQYLGIVGFEAHGGHLAHPQTIEQHRDARPQSDDRRVEADTIQRRASFTGEAVQPIDKKNPAAAMTSVNSPTMV